ncbi:formylmethanofuran--tetrahydromethanopterin N-formyltransferase [Aureliella helgolandensis]|uniref:Formyltransferase/hydrolase complex subunit D n=1 Tax=Aureliella helgolandensis TaxID=2527968 RepID=A0A518G9U3_9BACT|nr:formylmethanofuran--tetrahydromethanopterin N-formyltransferase [Aureliella helgolandensis]QDV25339.1 Formyltransferase/hydrolase complex subunit D [Aureliella helgolandensis]
MSQDRNSIVEDTYAEGFRSIYAEFLVTARDRTWLDHCCHAVTGHASSTILCDSEVGVSQILDGSSPGQETPDGRIGAVIQVHVPRFRKDRETHLGKVLLARISQNVLTCPTARCFNRLDTEKYFKLGRKVAFFGDGHQFRDQRYGSKGWVVPTMGGEFYLTRRFGFSDGVMGGNLWFMSDTEEHSILAAERAAAAVNQCPDSVLTFPGGIASSASKAGSRYSFMIASTFAEYCPTLKSKLGESSRVPEGVQSIMEIVINGSSLSAVAAATYAAIDAALGTPGLKRITAGNYNGRLGKSFIYLNPERQGA